MQTQKQRLTHISSSFTYKQIFTYNSSFMLNRAIHRAFFLFLKKNRGKPAFLACDVLKCPRLLRISLPEIKVNVWFCYRAIATS